MKKLTILLFATFLVTNVYGQTKNGKFKINELIILPHIGKIIKLNKKELMITKEQMQRISKEVKQVYPPKFQALIREAYPIERKIQRKVLKGATAKELKEHLDKVAMLKRESIDIKIEALNVFKKILSKEQWKKIIKLSK